MDSALASELRRKTTRSRFVLVFPRFDTNVALPTLRRDEKRETRLAWRAHPSLQT